MTLTYAKRLSLAAAVLLAAILAVVDSALINGHDDHAANCDCPGGAVALLLIGLIVAVCVVVIVLAAIAWLLHFRKSRGGARQGASKTGWWSRVLVLDGVLFVFAVAYPYGLTAGLLAATGVIALTLAFELRRSARPRS